MASENPTDELRTELSENDDGFCTLQVRTKRGDGTRDEDRVTATLGRDSLEAVEERRERMMDLVRATAEDAREIQPEDAEDPEDGAEDA
ncbi:DUF7389 domain-containing protein [Halococcus thailandensis]|uniref:DUF7389 domain-containing protein n=1 Tax=Halococcus thailandensis JCM 13552 TaxID=1227457 RepID=M0NG16_9EURY|nr:hypothetical protein [Halococcus thailandensis]EMA56801.1 hypothetical protein C451_00305 [Halococcus thailandensis JCM 13552]